MLKNMSAKIKGLMPRMLLVWKRLNQNISFKTNSTIVKKDLNYLDNNQIQEAKNYWKKYTNKYNVKYCSYYSAKTGIFDKRYIPDNLYYSYLEMHFNNILKTFGIDDKNLYDKLLPNLKQPQTILRKINGHYYDFDYNLKKFEDIQTFLNKEKKYVLKPSIDSSGGSGIVFFDNLNTKNLNNLLSSSNNYIIQKQVTQHRALRELHPNSLNTIRVISLFFKGKAHLLSSVLRIGVSGSNVDNAHGGIVVGIDENGCLKNKAYSPNGEKTYLRHPDTNIVFEGYKVPNYNEVLDIIKREAIKFPDFRMISWDLALDENGDVLFIEFNLRSGQLDFQQFTNGPLFGDLTDEVLQEVFK